MANSYFQFKQFLVQQHHSGMKVTTEGCLFGAWVASQNQPAEHVLDIGAGTGLLGLMLAQQNQTCHVDSVEVEESVFAEAKANIVASPFDDRMSVHHQPIQMFVPGKKYDLIISNPPFFSKALAASRNHEHVARHDDLLSQQDLLKSVVRLLAENGVLYVLYPEKEMNHFAERAGDYGLFLTKKLIVYSQPESAVFRLMCCFERKKNSEESTELIIRDENKAYTADFIELLKPYYLHL